MKILTKTPLPQYDIDDVESGIDEYEKDTQFTSHRCIGDDEQSCIDYLPKCCSNKVIDICLPCGRIVYYGFSYGHLGTSINPDCTL